MNINIAIIGDPEFAGQFGKKGTESDMTLYNFRKGDDTLTFLHPSRYPERLSSLLFILEQCDLAIIQVSEINATLGEIIVAIDAAAISRGYIYLTNYLQAEQITPLLAGMSMESFTFTDTPPMELKENILRLANPDSSAGPTLVPIDHHFNVKGIGPVILGIVREGTVARHQKLQLHPTGTTVSVRSIQTHDKDVNEAGIGERVGLALKGIETADIDRGMVLTDQSSEVCSVEKLQLDLTPSSFWKTSIIDDMVIHISTLMQMRPGRISNVQRAGGSSDPKHPTISMNVTFEKPLTLQPSTPIFVSYLEGGSLRVVGRARVRM